MTVLGKRVERTLGKILVATDFSSTSEKAESYAKVIVHRYASRIRLVHVVNLSAAVQMPDAGICIDILRKNGKESLERRRARFASEKITVEVTLTEGLDPAEAILEIARKESADLIISGTRGRGGLTRLVLGSTAERLIHHAECPVLTIGPETSPPDRSCQFQRVVYATDFSLEAAKAASFALSFPQDGGAQVYLCHILPKTQAREGVDSRECTEKFAAVLKDMAPGITVEWCEPECAVEHAYAADGILSLAHRVKAGLIVLGTRPFTHWFDGAKAGISYEVIRAASCPVLTIRG